MSGPYCLRTARDWVAARSLPDGMRMLTPEKTFEKVVNRSQCQCAVVSRDG